MENDQNKELDLELDIEDEGDSTSENKEPKTEGETVDYKALFEQEKAEKKKLERKLYAAKASPQSLPTNSKVKESIPDEFIQKVNKLELIEQKRQFGFEHGLSPEETDWIFQSTGGKPTKESLEVPFIKHGLEGYRASKRVEQNTPGSSSRSSVFAGKNFEELSSEERAKAFADTMKTVRK